mmetsp:Transcript_42018/g.70106  ORF Transcript_42018/g.70106 Transcript_42018/m.70106 type:complete len:401 (+) Transcript_42018:69-1271(+)|eukprot:CAMPEP_0198211988 /NCGR_PEP_ID=MMETSP1445-20131203/25459_1 /TAXON_ID=36898 /ORGANISM="Pyramimonas sp., Strain CCMP2087" /LENGTH=400 /DNA_ID=CAMNT_0043886355 /DNA_START=18 /DNA_END=1220 /DNA_ORIENTATION=+
MQASAVFGLRALPVRPVSLRARTERCSSAARMHVRAAAPVATSFTGLSASSRGAFSGVQLKMQRKVTTPMARKVQTIKATAGNAAPAPAAKAEGGVDLKLGFYFFLWYVFNIVFNLYNKSTLNIFPYPWFMSTIQLASGVFFMVALWVTKLYPAPKVSKELIIALIPVAFFHTVGHVSACVSFSKMAVSFTHIIKAAEPVLSVLLSWPLMGEVYSLPVYLSLIPIVAGCSLSAMKEVSFNMAGLNMAMLSNVGMVMRNIYSKKSLNNYVVDGVNLYALISIIAMVGLAPVAYFMEGAQWAAGYSTAVAKVGEVKFLQMLAAGGLFYHLYNQLSYQCLEGINPTTFSVGNTMKRVVVILASVAFFRNPVSPLNWVGSGMAIAGTYWYTQAKEAEKQAAKKK